MKIKINYFIAGFCLMLVNFFNVAAADTSHFHRVAIQEGFNETMGEYFYPCDIQIINDSYDKIIVQGTFDDGSSLPAFSISPREIEHRISLFYYGYCHAGMDIYINTIDGYRVYGAYTRVNKTIRIVPRT